MDIIAHIAQGFSIGDLHPLFVHFPIALFALGFVLDLLYWMFKLSVYPIGHWVIIGAALLAIPTLLTGLEAKESHLDSPYLSIHETLAIITLSYGLLHAFIRAYALTTKRVLNPLLFVILSFLNIALISFTAEYGGAITRGQPLFLWESKSSSLSDTQ